MHREPSGQLTGWGTVARAVFWVSAIAAIFDVASLYMRVVEVQSRARGFGVLVASQIGTNRLIVEILLWGFWLGIVALWCYATRRRVHDNAGPHAPQINRADRDHDRRHP